MKKILWLVGGLFIAVVVALVTAPLFIEVDQYRPQIVAELNRRINGKVELGKLKLSLWGSLKIHAEGIAISALNDSKPMVEAKVFYVQVPYGSIIKGKPDAIIHLVEPELRVVKDASGKTNILQLFESKESQAALDQITTFSSAAEKSAPMAVPALLAQAKLGLKLNDGALNYTDVVGKGEYNLQPLDLEINNLGLGTEMDFNATAPLRGKKDTLAFEGPLSIAGKLAPSLEGNQVKRVRGAMELRADDLSLSGPGFKKEKGKKFQVKMEFDGDQKQAVIKQLELRFHEMVVHGKGMVDVDPLTLKMDFNSEPFRMGSLQDLVPALAPFKLAGNARFNVVAEMRNQTPKLNGDVKITEGSFAYPERLKAPMGYQLQAGFSESQVTLTRLTLTGQEFDGQVTGFLRNFLTPQFSLNIVGKSWNLDQMIRFPSTAQANFSFVQEAFADNSQEKNPMLALAKNPIAAAASGNIHLQVANLISSGTKLEKLQAKGELKQMVFQLTEASFTTFRGKVNTKGVFQLKSPTLGYTSMGTVEGLDTKAAFSQFFPKYAGTIEGAMNANWNVAGNAYPPALRMRTLTGKARLAASNGALKSVSFQDSIDSLFQKVPFLKGKKPVAIDEGFKSLVADVDFQGGVVKVNPLEIEPKGKGFRVKGRSTIQESMDQESFLDLYDPQGILPKEFQKAGKPAVGLKFTGNLLSPKLDAEYAVKTMVASAGANVVKDAAAKAIEKVFGAPKEEGGNPLKDAAEKLKKKFKF